MIKRPVQSLVLRLQIEHNCVPLIAPTEDNKLERPKRLSLQPVFGLSWFDFWEGCSGND